MQIKVFSIPIIGGEAQNEEMNLFLRSHKILHVEERFIEQGKGSCWCFSIRYVEGAKAGERKKEKVDYRETLDAESFKRFSAYRDIRRDIYKREAIPAYAVFTDEELSKMAKVENLTEKALRKIAGIGLKKVEKYGIHFIKPSPSETN